MKALLDNFRSDNEIKTLSNEKSIFNFVFKILSFKISLNEKIRHLNIFFIVKY